MKTPLFACLASIVLCGTSAAQTVGAGQEPGRSPKAPLVQHLKSWSDLGVPVQANTASPDALQAAAERAATGAADAARAAGRTPPPPIVAVVPPTPAAAKPVEAVPVKGAAKAEPSKEVVAEVKKPEPPKPPPKPTWNVEIKDLTLAKTFERWASVAGWRVRWDAGQNVMVEAPDSFVGTFEDAITAQLSSPGIAQGAYPLEVCFYPNVPPLARITRKGDQVKECQ